MNSKKKKLYLILIFLLSVVLAVIASIYMLKKNSVKLNAKAAQERAYQLMEGLDFTDDCVIVVLNSKFSEINKVHNASLFKGIELTSIEDLTKRVNNKNSNDQEFRQILKIELKEHSKENVLRAVQFLNDLDCVYLAEPNYLYDTTAVANDIYYSDNLQWGLNGQYGINTEYAWEYSKGSSWVRVGIMDSGISEHPDLKSNLKSGKNFADESDITNNVSSQHGTHVAGIIGAVGNNNTGIVGVNWNVSLVPMQITDSKNHTEEAYVLRAIDWACDQWGTDEQIDIINYSISGFGENIVVREKIREFPGLFVWSAGNNNQNIDSRVNANGSFDLPNLISVGAIKSNGYRATDADWGVTPSGIKYGSNYGNSVNIFAPGDSILSTVPVEHCVEGTCDKNAHFADGYHYLSGTSMAAPHVTGVAALLLAKNPSLTSAQLKEAILNNADTIPSMSNAKRLNAYKAVDSVSAPNELFGGGLGTDLLPYLIYNKEQFKNIDQMVSADRIIFSYKLMANLNLGEDWEPIRNKFGGVLDGAGHSITFGVAITKQKINSNFEYGLFRNIYIGGEVKNLILKDCNVSTTNESMVRDDGTRLRIGVLAGTVSGAIKISNVRVVNPFVFNATSNADVGGLMGYQFLTPIRNCSVENGDIVSYSSRLGGMAGYGDINDFSGGSVSGIITKEMYEDTDQIGEVVGNSTNTSDVSVSCTINRNKSCLAAGTMITLADGSQVPVESLTGDEMLLVWNLCTGMYDSAPILFIDSDPEKVYRVITLTFSDGTSVNVISEHGFWDYDLNQYVYLDQNASEYVGHWFCKQGAGGNERVQLTGVSISEAVTTAYSPVTYGHLCYFVNGMLSMPGGIDGLFNIFEVDAETMRYDEAQMAADIEEFGLFTYEEFAQLAPVSEEAFEALNGQYLKVAIGKGLVSVETLQGYAARYAEYLN